NTSGKELVSFGGGTGIGLGLEYIIYRPLTINLGGQWGRQEALAQYSYKGNRASNLDTTSTEYSFYMGPRFRFIDFDHFRVFLGTGAQIGNIDFKYDKESYINRTGSSGGFKSTESSSLMGFYLELGFEFIINAHHAFRII